MLPLRDVIPSRTVPVVTLALIGLNLATFGYGLTLEPGQWRMLSLAVGVSPAAPALHTVLTAPFLHDAAVPLVANLLCLWIFGNTVEDRLGHARFVAFYLASATGASLGYVLTQPETAVPLVGASGAVAGVMGGYVVLFPRSCVLVLVPLIVYWNIIEVPAVWLIGVWVVVQLADSLTGAPLQAATQPLLDLATLLAGFATGACLVLVLRRPERLRVDWWG